MITAEKFIAGDKSSKAYKAICGMLSGHDVGVSYADMMRYRIDGKAADQCNDVYYVAHEDGKGYSRHWMGWGKHKDAIGNWGNFFTDEAARGKGYGGMVLDLWFEDFKNTENLPLAFFCSTGTEALTKLYARFGFRTVHEDAKYGFLYLPVGNSPETFREFAELYYKPSNVLIHKKATIGNRHELDCLLKFTLSTFKERFIIGDIDCIEKALLYNPQNAGMLFSEDGHCVGWSYKGEYLMHPLYRKCEIIDEFNI